MVILNKNQVEIEVKSYKVQDKIKVMFPDEAWTKHHFSKSDYNIRIARINFNLNKHKDFLKELENLEEPDPEFNTYEWVIIMGYYAMFHSVNALLRKIGVKIGKQYAHEITTNLLLHYFYYTRIIEDELLKIYPRGKIKYVYKDEDPRDYRVDFSKIKSGLGFKITKTVPDGIKEINRILTDGIITDPYSKTYKNI